MHSRPAAMGFHIWACGSACGSPYTTAKWFAPLLCWRARGAIVGLYSALGDRPPSRLLLALRPQPLPRAFYKPTSTRYVQYSNSHRPPYHPQTAHSVGTRLISITPSSIVFWRASDTFYKVRPARFFFRYTPIIARSDRPSASTSNKSDTKSKTETTAPATEPPHYHQHSSTTERLQA